VRGSGQGGIKSRVEFIECQPALREVLTQGRGSGVPVGVASARAWCWCLMILPGHPGQLPQHGGVAIQRGPALAGEGDGGLGSIAAGLSRRAYPARPSSCRQMIRLPGGSLIMSCSRATDSASP
jgi:hypothetical protein